MATIPLRNSVYEIVKNAGSMTDSELSKALIKSGISIPEDEFNKTLLNLEIYGLIKVTWLKKMREELRFMKKRKTKTT